MKTLIITEKPSVAKDFAHALNVAGKCDGYLENNDYIITWAIGHLVELFEPEDYDKKWSKWRIDNLPILPERFLYKPIENTEKQLNVIKKLLKTHKIDRLVIATDAGREGEVIARTILMISDFQDISKAYRFWTSQALTPQVISDGMKSLQPASDFDRLWRAGQARQIADWLVGMNSSRAATIQMNDLFSVGRVQTAVLSLLADRRREREKFKPEPYWLLYAVFSNPKGIWKGLWFNKNNNRFKDEIEANNIATAVLDKTGCVQSVKKQKKKEPSPQLYSLTDLQRDANTKFGFSAKHTLDIAQRLYEEKKCLSYPRTDSKVLGSKNVSMAKTLVEKLSPAYPDIFAGVEEKRISLSNKRVFNDAALTDHHALIPLAPLPKTASKDESLIYDLVLRRFAGVFHLDCEFEQTEIITAVEKETFRTRGKVILKAGWRVLELSPDPSPPPPKRGNEGRGDLDEEDQQNLPPLFKDDPAHVDETKPVKKMTTPPPEYSEALLLKDMTNPARYVSEHELKKIYRGDVGLGTQATRAQTIETLLNRKYVERRKKHILATDKGCRLIDTLRQFPIAKNLASPEETARWERQLDLIAQGDLSGESFLDGIRVFVKQTVEEFKQNPMINEKTTINLGKCPNCGGTIIEGKRGFGCSNWREKDGGCKFVVWKNISGKIITPQIAALLIAQKQAGPFDGFMSQDNRRFSAIIRIEQIEDKWQVKIEPVPDMAPAPNAIGRCPACGGDIVESQKAYGCSNWRDKDGGCKFAIWKTIAGKEISKEIAIALIQNGITEKLEGFISKKGNPFATRLKVESDETGKLKVVFDFSDR